jgi:hypothetical protein
MLFRDDGGFYMVLICAKSFIFVVLGADPFFFDRRFRATSISFRLVFFVVHFWISFTLDVFIKLILDIATTAPDSEYRAKRRNILIT